MFKRGRGTFFAIGLVIGCGIASLFLVWSFPGFRNPTYQDQRYGHAYNYDTGENNPVVRPSFWETYTSPTDTYAQWIMAILAVAATIVTAVGVYLVYRTLREAQRTTKAAIDAARAAQESVDEARNAAKISERSLRVTRASAKLQHRQAKASTEAMLEANRIAIDDRRAWISIEDIKISEPTVFDQGGMRLTLMFTVKNVGRMPAINVFPSYTVRSGRIVNHGVRREAHREFCEEIRNRLEGRAHGYMMFPGQIRDMGLVVTMSREEIDEDIQNSMRVPDLPDVIQPIVLGCISYQITGSDEMHQTGFGCELYDKDDESMAISGNLVRVDDQPIPVDRISVVPMAIVDDIFFAT